MEAELGGVETDAPAGFRDGPFQTPFGAFIPRNVDGFLVAEKNLSVSRLANGAIRLRPISLLTGQAAGTIAALAIERNAQPRALPPVLVQRRLLASGLKLALYVYTDVPRSHVYWKDTNLIAMHGIMIGTGSQQLKSLGIAVTCSTGGFCPDQTIPVGACYRTPPNYCQ